MSYLIIYIIYIYKFVYSSLFVHFLTHVNAFVHWTPSRTCLCTYSSRCSLFMFLTIPIHNTVSCMIGCINADAWNETARCVEKEWVSLSFLSSLSLYMYISISIYPSLSCYLLLHLSTYLSFSFYCILSISPSFLWKSLVLLFSKFMSVYIYLSISTYLPFFAFLSISNPLYLSNYISLSIYRFHFI